MGYRITGNTALVAASSSGLGTASAKALAKEGANVVIDGRDEQRLRDAAADVERVAEGDVVLHQGDLTNPDDVERLVDTTVDAFGGIDHLVKGVERGEYESYKDGLAQRSGGIPLGRLGPPGEFGEVVAFLCSEQSAYVTGTAIPVDGGNGRSNL